MLTAEPVPVIARTYAAVTALLGALYVVYNTLWIGQPEPPFRTPAWLVYAQLAWGLISFGAVFIYQRDDRSPVLPALYVTYTAATYAYVWYVGATRGEVLDELVPTWWKIVAGLAGLVFMVEGFRQVRLSHPAGIDRV